MNLLHWRNFLRNCGMGLVMATDCCDLPQSIPWANLCAIGLSVSLCGCPNNLMVPDKAQNWGHSCFLRVARRMYYRRPGVRRFKHHKAFLKCIEKRKHNANSWNREAHGCPLPFFFPWSGSWLILPDVSGSIALQKPQRQKSQST